MKEKYYKLAFLAIFFLGAFFRLYGVNWDQDQHLHPDERFLTMVSTGIDWPKSVGEFLNTSISPLNPHNKGFDFFVYGTFPVFFTKWVAESLGKGDYVNLTLVGRQLSAFFDLGTVLIVFLIAKEIFSNIEYRNSKNNIVIARSRYKSNEAIPLRSKGRVVNSSFFGWIRGLLHHVKTWFAMTFHAPEFGIRIFPLVAMFLYSIMVLPIQLSHFYAVDTYLTFFITLSFYLLIKIINSPQKLLDFKFLILNSLLGISFGLAIASKITAIFFLPIIGLGLIYFLFKYRNFFLFIVICSLFFVLCYFTVRFAQPYLFNNTHIFTIVLNPKVLANWKQLKSFDDSNGGFPPAVQWITTKPFAYAFKNLIFWGLGLPLGIIVILAVLFLLMSIFQHLLKKDRSYFQNIKQLILNLSLLWIIFLFSYQCIQFSKNMRYLLPIYPFLAIISAYFIYQLINKFKIKSLVFIGVLVLLVLIYPVSFLSIYTQPHSRVTASEWIYNNIPSGSTRAIEHWDDGLPLSLPQNGYQYNKYPSVELPLYGADNQAKWKEMDTKLKQTDFIVLSSNRLYGSIMTVPNKFPITYRYYKALFDGSLGFEKVAEFTSRPNVSFPFFNICLTPPFSRYGIIALPNQECNLPGISFVDDYADESFTVYDHPKVIIFKKVAEKDYLSLLYRNQ